MEDTKKKDKKEKKVRNMDLAPKNFTFWFSRKDINTEPCLKEEKKKSQVCWEKGKETEEVRKEVRKGGRQ